MAEPTTETPSWEGRLFEWADRIEGVQADEAYCARVDLPGGDHVTVYVLNMGTVRELLQGVRENAVAAMSIYAKGKEADKDGASPDAALASALADENLDAFEGTLDKFVARVVRAWDMPALANLEKAIEPDRAPNANMPSAERVKVLRALPLPVLARILLGSVWLLKNSLWRSSAGSPASPPAS